MDVVEVAGEVVGSGGELHAVRVEVTIEPLPDGDDLVVLVGEVQVHGAHRDAGTLGGLARRQGVAVGLGELFGECFEDRLTCRRRLRLPLRADVAASFGHSTNSMPWLAATRTTPGMSGGLISTSADTSVKNFVALPRVTMVKK